MLQAIEAIINEDGGVRLLEEVHTHGAKRAIITILDEDAELPLAHETALLSEKGPGGRLESPGGGGMVTPSAGSVALVPFLPSPTFPDRS